MSCHGCRLLATLARRVSGGEGNCMCRSICTVLWAPSLHEAAWDGWSEKQQRGAAEYSTALPCRLDDSARERYYRIAPVVPRLAVLSATFHLAFMRECVGHHALVRACTASVAHSRAVARPAVAAASNHCWWGICNQRVECAWPQWHVACGVASSASSCGPSSSRNLAWEWRAH